MGRRDGLDHPEAVYRQNGAQAHRHGEEGHADGSCFSEEDYQGGVDDAGGQQQQPHPEHPTPVLTAGRQAVSQRLVGEPELDDGDEVGGDSDARRPFGGVAETAGGGGCSVLPNPKQHLGGQGERADDIGPFGDMTWTRYRPGGPERVEHHPETVEVGLPLGGRGEADQADDHGQHRVDDGRRFGPRGHLGLAGIRRLGPPLRSRTRRQGNHMRGPCCAVPPPQPTRIDRVGVPARDGERRVHRPTVGRQTRRDAHAGSVARGSGVPQATRVPSPLSVASEQFCASSSRGRCNAAASAATVKKAGVGIRPVSILRNVSTDTPDSPATSVMLRLPRAERSTAPSRRPRLRSSTVSIGLTMA